MIKRVHIKGYKSLEDVEIRLQPLSVLFGPNASGKSNFLDALQLLSGMATRQTLKEAFAPPYRGTPLESCAFGAQGIRGLLGRESASFVIEVDVALSPAVIDSVNRQIAEMKRRADSNEAKESNGSSRRSPVVEKDLRYRIEVEVMPQTGVLRVTDEYLAALNAQGEPSGKRKPFIERINDRLQLRMERQGHPFNYELLLDHSVLSKPHYPPHYPHVTAMKQELANCFFFYFEPRERMRAPTPVKEVRHIGLMGEDLAAFLNTLKALERPRFETLNRALRMILPSVKGVDVEVNDLGEAELRLIEDDTPVPARLLSEGTLRLLGLLALRSAKEPPAVIGFEEPENGMHPRRIELIAELLKTGAFFGDTQIIVTTHSTILTDLVPSDSLFVFRKVNGRTEVHPYCTWGPLFRTKDIESALDGGEDALPVSTRILRGDFDA